MSLYGNNCPYKVIINHGFTKASGYGKSARVFFIVFNLVVVWVMMNIFAGSIISSIQKVTEENRQRKLAEADGIHGEYKNSSYVHI